MYQTRRRAIGTVLSASLGGILPSLGLLNGEARSRGGGTAQPKVEEARNRIRQAIEQGKATGVAIAVAFQGRIILEEGFGWANREEHVKVTPHTPFSLASITKPFTATMLMTLVAEGKLKLDAPANNYLGEDGVSGINGDPGAVTVRMLGAHSSGLPGMFESYYRSEAKLALTPGALLRQYGRLAYPPGTCYEYSNIGFAALSAVASKVASLDFATLLQRRVLTPLGLNDSFFDTDLSRIGTGAVRYDPLGNAIPYYTTSTPASGEWYASAHDLALFAMFTMKSRTDSRKPILRDRWIDELLRPAFVGPSGVATTFGWFTGRLRSGMRFVTKGGGQPGVGTVMHMVPSKNLACLVLTNQSNARELANDVCDLLMESHLPEWQQPREDSGYQPMPFVLAPPFPGRWCGTLQNGGAKMPVTLHIESSKTAEFTIGTSPAAPVTDLRSEGDAFTGTTMGSIDSPDAQRAEATTLGIKLVTFDGKLVGRVSATSGNPDFRNARLPYVVTLDRA
jgi:CubicO group peptidase (beta-lactamase class C family)